LISPTPVRGDGEDEDGDRDDDIDIDLEIDFQGMHGQNHKDDDEIPVHVIVDGKKTHIEKVTVAKPNGKGTFTATIHARAHTGSGNSIYVKGFHHLRHKFCTDKQSDNGQITKPSCSTGTIQIKGGLNVFNFSQTTLVAGDTIPQDGVIDSFDVSQVRRCMGKSDLECLNNADMNRDGIVDSQDMSLVVQGLTVRYEDPAPTSPVGVQQGTVSF
jgi:hypothetical protein